MWSVICAIAALLSPVVLLPAVLRHENLFDNEDCQEEVIERNDGATVVSTSESAVDLRRKATSDSQVAGAGTAVKRVPAQESRVSYGHSSHGIRADDSRVPRLARGVRTVRRLAPFEQREHIESEQLAPQAAAGAEEVRVAAEEAVAQKVQEMERVTAAVRRLQVTVQEPAVRRQSEEDTRRAVVAGARQQIAVQEAAALKQQEETVRERESRRDMVLRARRARKTDGMSGAHPLDTTIDKVVETAPADSRIPAEKPDSVDRCPATITSPPPVVASEVTRITEDVTPPSVEPVQLVSPLSAAESPASPVDESSPTVSASSRPAFEVPQAPRKKRTSKTRRILLNTTPQRTAGSSGISKPEVKVRDRRGSPRWHLRLGSSRYQRQIALVLEERAGLKAQQAPQVVHPEAQPEADPTPIGVPMVVSTPPSSPKQPSQGVQLTISNSDAKDSVDALIEAFTSLTINCTAKAELQQGEMDVDWVSRAQDPEPQPCGWQEWHNLGQLEDEAMPDAPSQTRPASVFVTLVSDAMDIDSNAVEVVAPSREVQRQAVLRQQGGITGFPALGLVREPVRSGPLRQGATSLVGKVQQVQIVPVVRDHEMEDAPVPQPQKTATPPRPVVQRPAKQAPAVLPVTLPAPSKDVAMVESTAAPIKEAVAPLKPAPSKDVAMVESTAAPVKEAVAPLKPIYEVKVAAIKQQPSPGLDDAMSRIVGRRPKRSARPPPASTVASSPSTAPVAAEGESQSNTASVVEAQASEQDAEPNLLSQSVDNPPTGAEQRQEEGIPAAEDDDAEWSAILASICAEEYSSAGDVSSAPVPGTDLDADLEAEFEEWHRRVIGELAPAAAASTEGETAPATVNTEITWSREQLARSPYLKLGDRDQLHTVLFANLQGCRKELDKHLSQAECDCNGSCIRNSEDHLAWFDHLLTWHMAPQPIWNSEDTFEFIVGTYGERLTRDKSSLRKLRKILVDNKVPGGERCLQLVDHILEQLGLNLSELNQAGTD